MDKEAKLLKVLGEPIRLRMAVLLAMEGELCVCQLAEAVNQPQYKVSRHLGLMRSAGLVEARREGTWMHYQLAGAGCDLHRHLYAFLAEGFKRYPMTKADRMRLRKATCGK